MFGTNVNLKINVLMLAPLPATGATAQASYANFAGFLDTLGLACGMTGDNLTKDWFRNRQHGVVLINEFLVVFSVSKFRI